MSHNRPLPCIRCGVIRQARPERSGLCGDCRYTMSREEQRIWAA